MTIRYVPTDDNKYVQYRLTTQNFTTNVTQWQGVDDTPTPESNNLVKSSGVYDITSVLGDKLIKLTGWGASHSLAPNIGDVYYNTNRKTLIKRVQSGESTTIVDIPFYDGAIYQYQNDLYIWNGTDLISKTTLDTEPIENSIQGVQSGGVFEKLLNICINSAEDVTIGTWNTGSVNYSTGRANSDSNYRFSQLIAINAGNILAVKAFGAASIAGITEHINGYGTTSGVVGIPKTKAITAANAKYKFFIAKVDTNVIVCTSAGSLTDGIFQIKKLDNEVVREIARNYQQTIANYLNTINVDGRVLPWNEIPAIDGQFGATEFIFSPSDVYTHKVIPVKAGDEIVIDKASARTYYAFIKSYSPPAMSNVCTIDYATSSAQTIVNSSNRNVHVTAPSDAKYLLLYDKYNTNNWAPSTLIINGYDVMCGVKQIAMDAKTTANSMKFPLYMSYDDIPIKSGNLGTNGIENLNASPSISGHRELPVKAGQLVRIYPCSTRVGIAVVKSINADGTFVRATGYSENINRLYSAGPINVSVPYDGNTIVISEYFTSDNTTHHWYAEDIIIDGASIVKTVKNDNFIFKSLLVENMLLGGDPITPVEFTYAISSGGDSLDDGSVCAGYCAGTTRYSESSVDNNIVAMSQFNMLNPILTQESYKALKDGDVVMWNRTNGQPDPEGNSVVWRGMGIGSIGITGNTSAKFIDSNNIRILAEAGNCICYVDFNRTTKSFETTEYEGQTINVGHMVLLKIGNTYYKSNITSSYVENIETAISAIDSNFQRYGSNAALAYDSNPVRLGGYYWATFAVSNCGCLFKSVDLKVFEFVCVIPAGHYSREVELAPKGDYLYGIVRGWKNAFPETGSYSQLFRYNLNDGTFSEFVELTGLCGERPAFAIVDDKIYTINRLGNGAFAGTTIQRADKMFQVFDLDFNLLNSVHLNFIRGCNTIQFLVHAKQLYAFIPTDRRGFVFTKSAEGRNDLIWTYIDVRYLNK